MKRVMIVGGPGSGKSTLATKLGDVTGLPVYHMDHIHYQSGWVERNPAIKSAMTNEIHQKDEWIFEGGHSATYQQRLLRADTLIWLDLPVGLRIVRVIRRSLRYRGTTRPDLPAGCPEQFNGQTIDFLRFIWRTRNTSRAKIQAMVENPPTHLRVLGFNNQAAIDNFFRQQSEVGGLRS